MSGNGVNQALLLKLMVVFARETYRCRLMNRRLTAIFLCFSLPLHFVEQKTNAQPQTVQQDKPAELATVQDPDEYAVWSVLVLKYTEPNHHTYIIRDRTTTESRSRAFGPHAYEYLSSEEAYSDLQAKNKEQYRLENKLSVTPPCVFTSREKEESLFPALPTGRVDEQTIKKMQNSWDQFYREYPGVSGMLTFSRVGFNSDKSEAVVYVRYDGGVMAHSGSYVVLTRQRESWEIKTQKVIWLS
jgi:hypothetical protein